KFRSDPDAVLSILIHFDRALIFIAVVRFRRHVAPHQLLTFVVYESAPVKPPLWKEVPNTLEVLNPGRSLALSSAPWRGPETLDIVMLAHRDGESKFAVNLDNYFSYLGLRSRRGC